jgi:diguanylate cyclase (GGDEF)-like protein
MAMTTTTDGKTATDAGTAPRMGPLGASLLDSRERWREFSLLAADLLFETDLDGRITFLAPDRVLGWPASALHGGAADALLIEPEAEGTALDRFRFATPARGRRVWLRNAAGEAACLAVSSQPMLDPAGQRIGTRGVGLDVTAQERREMAAAAALRRADVLDHTLDQMRQEVTAPRMIEASLLAIMRATGGRGAALLDLADAPLDEPPALPWPVLHQVGDDPLPVLADALALLDDQDDAVAAERTPQGCAVLACPAYSRFGDRAGLVVWRDAGGRAWDADDRTLAASVAGLIRMMLEHGGIQRELALQARTDPLTSLLNRRAFVEEAARRIDRLDREALPGTLLVVDLDRLRDLNDRSGHGAGDAALMLTADLLRRVFRPADLIARLGGDEFAVWMDGSDEMTAAERAEGLRIGYPRVASHLADEEGADGEGSEMTVSIGIASRRSGNGETLDSLMQRADQAVHDAKRAGPGHWRVSHAGPML